MSDITKRKIKENIQRDLEEYQKEREPGMMNASQDEIVQWTELIKKLS